MKWIRPSPTFEILLPDNIVHRADERVSSFWMDGEPTLLQLSSYLKLDDNRPIPARLRLEERIAKSVGQWKIWDDGRFFVEGAEQAIAETVDPKGHLWIHSYLVWPHLTVYATLSGPKDEVRCFENWAAMALKTIKLTAK